MHVKNLINSLAFFVFAVIFCGCDVMDTFLPSSTYKINARVNGISLDECSFVTANDKIQPYFEESVAGDPDVTALMIFFRNNRGEIIGSKALYNLDGEAARDEISIHVESLGGSLPFIPMPSNFPVGRFTMVSQVMRGREILQRTEKSFFYMGNTGFIYDGINVHLPGITDNSQIIPREMTVLLETKLEFSGQVDPYIVWYNGRRKISEGKYSDGANYLLWEAPEQSGFYSVTAEVFPSDSHIGLSGYQKEVSLLVSAKTMDMNLVSENIPQLVHWYTFEGNLNDSKLMNPSVAAANTDHSLKTLANTRQYWLSANGSYGLAAGYDRTYALPVVYGYNNWQTLFRFKPIDDGSLFFAQFSSDVFLTVSIEGQYLILTLLSPARTVSQKLNIQKSDGFITAGVSFSILRGSIAAHINIFGNDQNELPIEPVYLSVDIDDNFQIVLGHKREDNVPLRDRPVLTAIWDEFAVYKAPPMDIILADVRKAAELSASRQNYISSN